MICSIRGELADLKGPFNAEANVAISRLSGRRRWFGDNKVVIEASASNLRLLQKVKAIDFQDPGGVLVHLEAMINAPTQDAVLPLVRTSFKPKRLLAEFQEQILSLSWQRPAYAILLEMGLRKTATTLINAGHLHASGLLTGMLVICYNGLQSQWLEEALPLDWDDEYKTEIIIWKNRPIKWPTRFLNYGPMEFFAINYEAVRSKKGFDAAVTFLERHPGLSMIVADESQRIKSNTAQVTEAVWKLGELAKYRRILTGTPLSRNLEDAWAQFKFLDINILGYKYITTFRHRFCIANDYYQSIDSRNEEEFYRLIAPHSYRKLKSELGGLPPKIYSVRPYDMGPETRKHYNEIKEQFLTMLNDGTEISVPNKLVQMLRLQQIVCGYLPTGDEGKLFDLSHERIGVILDVIEQLVGSVVVWARFTNDILRIKAALEKVHGPESVVTYYGADSAGQRALAKKKFMERRARFFVSNPAVGGTGVDGLQTVCHSAIYYSNSFRALDRWQSEDRTWRDGMGDEPCTYIDIIARGSIDLKFRNNLQSKKSMADLTLDEIRMMLTEEAAA